MPPLHIVSVLKSEPYMIQAELTPQQQEQLLACPYALLLGLNTDNNLIERLLNFARKLLKVDNGLLCFGSEPLMWHAHSKGLTAQNQVQHALFAMVSEYQLIDQSQAQHRTQYDAFSAQLNKMGFIHSRFVALNLMRSDGKSLGFAVWFDQNTQAFDASHVELLQEYCGSFMRHIEMKFNFEQLSDLYEQQCAQNYSKTKFFSIIAHDLRAPFHGLLGFSEVLAKERDSLDESSVQNIADYLYDTTQSTYNLLESLLNWAMSEAGRFVHHPVSFELKQISQIVCDVLGSLALKKQIQLIDEVPEGVRLYADINMLTSVLQNLVSNALKFTPVHGHGVVRIQAMHYNDSMVEFVVNDNGLGMTALQMQNVFNPQLKVSFKGTSGETGAGLGLTLCKRFVDLNQGVIMVESEENQGTTFRVRLPARMPSESNAAANNATDRAEIAARKTTATASVKRLDEIVNP